MRFWELLEKTTPGDAHMFPMHEAGKFWLGNGTGQLRGSIADNLKRFDAARAAHSWNVLPRLLKAIEAERKAQQAFRAELKRGSGGWDPTHLAKMDLVIAERTNAENELDAAIAAAREVPDA